MDLSFLPAVNATLNGIAALLLAVGYAMIRSGRIRAHACCMIGAFSTSAVFLVSYVTHYVWRAGVKGGAHTPYNAEGLLKTFYYLMLLSHILLALAVPVLAIRMLWLAGQRRFENHRRLGRVAVPIWFYVSVTGVLIYFMLYQWNPPAP